jgi:hypothetical protein
MNISYIINSLFGVEGKNKNTKIAEVIDVTVAASGNDTVISDFSLSNFPYHYIVVKPNNSHKYRINEQYQTGSLSVPYPAISVVDYSVNGGGRTVTDWLKAKGETVHIDIENLDSENSHTYSVFVMGVR